jgi:hypothetical protein
MPDRRDPVSGFFAFGYGEQQQRTATATARTRITPIGTEPTRIRQKALLILSVWFPSIGVIRVLAVAVSSLLTADSCSLPQPTTQSSIPLKWWE